MNTDQLKELVTDCPSLFHMAERGAWPGISANGLLSTSSLLDLYQVDGENRYAIEAQRRGSCVDLIRDGFPSAVVRDQLPMDDKGLRRCLPEEITPSDWYRFLNKKVFFWLTEDRLFWLTRAKAYRDVEHEVLVVDTARLVDAYFDKIWMCPINSGCTKPMPHPRDYNTFLRIADYPYETWRKKRKRGERVVELCVDDGVPDIAEFVKRVFVIKGPNKIADIVTSQSPGGGVALAFSQ